MLDESSLTLPNGSLLVLYTDGMTDCRNPQGEPFGLERIKHSLANLSKINAQVGCDELFEKLMKYQDGSKQDDDVTLLAVHRR
jgi:sigma-B regulation protein RsbU (phosphoserine phosphatase)